MPSMPLPQSAHHHHLNFFVYTRQPNSENTQMYGDLYTAVDDDDDDDRQCLATVRFEAI